MYRKYFISITLIIISHSHAFITINSDNQKISSSLYISDTIAIKLGDSITFNNFNFGGFVEIRNEARFNQSIFPNHNWRGFLNFSYDLKVMSKSNFVINIPFAIQHESAHPTTGIKVDTDEAYHKIYDDTYRYKNMNSFHLGCEFTYKGIVRIDSLFHYRFYFLSKNTPELSDNRLAISHGLSGGIELSFKIYKNLRAIFSLMDHYVFRGRQYSYGDIYMNSDNGYYLTKVIYPIINKSNQLCLTAGISIYIKKINRKLNVYFKFINGNKGGFIDSRETGNYYFAGISLQHH